MKHIGRNFPLFLICFVIFGLLTFKSDTVKGALLYKTYLVRQDKGWDILCDPYILKKDDYIYKLFRERGEIAEKEFPEFLQIFKRLNPDIDNINHVLPGQSIIIPLKKIQPGTFENQSSGRVMIPYVTFANIPAKLKRHSNQYTVRQGDCVSIIISKFYGKVGTDGYKEGVKIFKFLNPKVTNIDKIFPGQVLTVPSAALRDKEWYSKVFDAQGNIAQNDSPSEAENSSAPLPAAQPAITAPPSSPSSSTSISPLPLSSQIAPPINTANDQHALANQHVLDQITTTFDAKLVDKGIISFPLPNGEDLKIDFSKMPIIDFKNGSRLLLSKSDAFNSDEMSALRAKWNNLKFIDMPSDISIKDALAQCSDIADYTTEQLTFDDKGIKVNVRAKWIVEKANGSGDTSHICTTLIQTPEEQTPDAICRYLAHHNVIIKDLLEKSDLPNPMRNTIYTPLTKDQIDFIANLTPQKFIEEFAKALGYYYAENVKMSFPYAGIQIETYINMITAKNGKQIFIDFGNIYGDAIPSIEKMGLEVIQINPSDSIDMIISKLFDKLGISYKNNPSFLAANRSPTYNTSLKIPGFLVDESNNSRLLLTTAPLFKGLVYFLNEKGIKVILLGVDNSIYS